MTKRIFRTIFAVAVSVFLCAALLFLTVLYDYFSGIQKRQIQIQTDLAAQGVESGGIHYLRSLTLSDQRITWVKPDGGVLYDSMVSADTMESHLGREEIVEALQTGYGESDRYSATLTEHYLYSAKRLSDGTVIRLSITQNSLLRLTLGMLHPIAIMFVIAVILSLILASRLAQSIVKPLNKLNLDETPSLSEGCAEIAPLLTRLRTQQEKIRMQREELDRKQNEFETVTQGMREGIILISSTDIILSINHAASDLLELDSSAVGRKIDTIDSSPELIDLLHRSESGRHTEAVLNFKTARYQVDISPVLSDGKPAGRVILLLNVTEKDQSEQMRREFTANVSHELKTPLHTLSGYAELLASGMVKSEDVQKFSHQIYTEAGRMIHLVEDIIRLSHLDEGGDDLKWENVDLSTIAKEAMNSLATAAEAASLTLEFEGEPTLLYGVSQLLESIVYNLCDNAIKYNRVGGSVSVRVADNGDTTVLTVSDSGIGIPPEHRERIFERFYRVDKSHSKEIGGTGLGLSIVKHAARLHDATIDLQSTVGVGTTITVRFPKIRDS